MEKRHEFDLPKWRSGGSFYRVNQNTQFWFTIFVPPCAKSGLAEQYEGVMGDATLPLVIPYRNAKPPLIETVTNQLS